MVVLSIQLSGIGLKFPLIVTLPGNKTSKSCYTLFLAIFALNVNFPGKLEKCTGILFIQNGSVKCANEWNRTS